MTPKNELAEEVEGLRRFGRALARDNWLVCDERSAQVLVEKLTRQTALAVRDGEGPVNATLRLRLFSLFVRFYRKHMRMAMLVEGGSDSPPLGYSRGTDGREAGSLMEQAVRNLPLELRESLLLVVLERFSHSEAAQALDISLACLTERLSRGRMLLAAALAERNEVYSDRAQRQPLRRGVPYLRLVK